MNIFQQREKIIEDLIEAYREHDEEKTNHLLVQLKELDKPAEQEKPLPEEPQEKAITSRPMMADCFTRTPMTIGARSRPTVFGIMASHMRSGRSSAPNSRLKHSHSNE